MARRIWCPMVVRRSPISWSILQGEGVTLDLVGSIDIKKGVTSSTFASVPDAPIARFELKLPEGPHSRSAAVVPAKARTWGHDLCGHEPDDAHDDQGAERGTVIKQSTKITVGGCPKAKKKPSPRSTLGGARQAVTAKRAVTVGGEGGRDDGRRDDLSQCQGRGRAPKGYTAGARLGGAGAGPRRGDTTPADLGAIAQVAAERGAANVTVARIVARAGISRRTFYELFEDREACLLAALDEAVEVATAVVVPLMRHRRARRAHRAGLAALLVVLEEEPGLGRLCVVEALGAGDRALERRARCLAVLIEAVDGGRAEMAGGEQPPPMTAEGVAGKCLDSAREGSLTGPVRTSTRVHVLTPVHVLTRICPPPPGRGARRARARSCDLLGPLMAMIVLPCRAAAAAKELARPVPKASRPLARASRDPLEGLDMRLTYRTVRVLTGIAGHPGASNRTVAEASGTLTRGRSPSCWRVLTVSVSCATPVKGTLRGRPMPGSSPRAARGRAGHPPADRPGSRHRRGEHASDSLVSRAYLPRECVILPA